MSKDLIGREYPEITVSDSAKMTVQECVAETSKEDLNYQAVRHYEYLSSLAHEWSSYCSNAIKEYEINKDKIKKLEADLDVSTETLEKLKEIRNQKDLILSEFDSTEALGELLDYIELTAKQALGKIGRG